MLARKSLCQLWGPAFLVVLLFVFPNAQAQEIIWPDTLVVHDPSIVQDGSWFYVYCTGAGIPARRSQDLYDWESLGSVLSEVPQWVKNLVPGVGDLWAPDPVAHNGKFYLCYSGSQWGTQTSTIGLLSNVTLDPANPAYEWIDEGEIISSSGQSVNYNTIDGGFVEDANGDMWLTFGSFWTGIKIIRLNNTTLKPLESPPVIHAIASRGGGAIEAPYIIYRNGYYYLFVNFDACCQGVNSTYRIMVGRSTSITGPYLDKNGTDMMNGGGTEILAGGDRWKGPGHFSCVTINGQDFMPYHSYDALNSGAATLRIRYLYWDNDDWPVAGAMLTTAPSDTIAHWNFEDGTPGEHFPTRFEGPGSVDISGNGNHLFSYDDNYGPLFSDLGETASGQGLSAAFPGDNGRDGYTNGSMISQASLNTWTPLEWTIEVSVRLNDITGWETFVGKDGPTPVGGPSAPFYFQRSGDGTNQFRINFLTADGERYTVGADFNVTSGQWYHLVATCDGTIATLYADKLDGNGFQAVGSTPLNTANPGNDNRLYPIDRVWTVGRGWYDGSLVDHIGGFVDDVRFSNRVLELTEFLQYRPPVLVITPTDGDNAVSEEGPTSDTYAIHLQSYAAAGPPTENITVHLTADSQLSVDPSEIVFTPSNYGTDRPVTVTAVDDEVPEEDPHVGYVHHALTSGDSDYDGLPAASAIVSITENDCGAWGYLTEDYNFDCRVNLYDYAILASAWLGSLPGVADLLDEWLGTTQPFSPGAVHGPVDDPHTPLYVHPDTVLNTIDVNVYGHFLEHIYHSTNGGLWGDLVWNRSMEIFPGASAQWSIEGDELVQSSLGTNIRLLFGETDWSDYEFTCEARKTGGNEGFLIIVRADGNEFYWANLGGWGNSRHQFEKGYSGGNWGPVGSSTEGSIPTGQWLDLRVRCEGGHLQTWIDDDLMLDYTDSQPYLAGRVGLGTWATQARFRNLVVTDLDTSETLFSGLPAIENLTAGTADFWSSYGPGEFHLTGNALNDEYCQKIVAPGSSETGLRQYDINIQEQSYTGSLWARGDATVQLVVRLRDSSGVVAQQAIGSPSASWTQLPFVLNAGRSNLDGYLEIAVQGAGAVWIDQISMMGQDAINTGGYRPDLLAAVAALDAPTIRWPGGCYASAYRWKDGIGAQHMRHKYPLNLWDDQDVNSYGTDEFLQMCEDLGIEPIIVINCGVLDVTCGAGPIPHPDDPGEYLQDALDWIEYCNGPADSPWGAVRAANGHPEPYNVTYWEIDNETWGAGVSAYIAKVEEFAPAMKAVDPDIILLACGSGSYDQGWNQSVISACAPLINYISVHHYEGADNFANGPLSYENFLVTLGNVIDTSANPDMKIFMSEWNAQSTDWRTGLYAGGLLNAFERQGEHLTLGGPALFLRHLSAGAWDNAFINFDHTGWFPAPNYVVMNLWRHHYAPYRIDIDGQPNGVNLVATKSADGNTLYFKAVNTTDEEIPLKLVIDETFPLASASFQVVDPGSLYARNTLANPSAVAPHGGAVSVVQQVVRFTLPALSAGVVQLDREP